MDFHLYDPSMWEHSILLLHIRHQYGFIRARSLHLVFNYVIYVVAPHCLRSLHPSIFLAHLLHKGGQIFFSHSLGHIRK
jgi:hypothetical protein